MITNKHPWKVTLFLSPYPYHHDSFLVILLHDHDTLCFGIGDVGDR